MIRLRAAVAVLVLVTANLLPLSHGGTELRIVVSITPLHSLVAGVMEGVGEPVLLLRGSESPHAFSLRPSDARRLRRADAVFWIGPALEKPLQRVIEGLEVQAGVPMLETPGLTRLTHRELKSMHDEEHGQTHEHGHDHDHGGTDPHVWLSVNNALAMNAEIARVLVGLDPDNAQRYRDNAARQQARLRVLDDELRAGLDGIEGRFAVFHDAYQYFERAYSLNVQAAVTTHPERAPGARHLHELRHELEHGAVQCLFSEPQYDSKLVTQLTQDLAVRHAVLDPLGADIPPGIGAYAQIMRTLADTLATCMQGGKRQ